jgi:MerR family redox-sensitive transcriptional activator SoxR
VTIGEVSKRSGVPASALRWYEDQRLLPRAQRVNGRRVYDESVFLRLRVIDVAQEAGFTVAEIRQLLHGFSPTTPPSERWRTLARRKLPEVNDLIERAQAMKRILEEALECECMTLEECELLTRDRGASGGRRPAARSRPPAATHRTA